jgi:hypothetical protein
VNPSPLHRRRIFLRIHAAFTLSDWIIKTRLSFFLASHSRNVSHLNDWFPFLIATFHPTQILLILPILATMMNCMLSEVLHGLGMLSVIIVKIPFYHLSLNRRRDSQKNGTSGINLNRRPAIRISSKSAT